MPTQCNEARPTCSACVRHNVRCSYPGAACPSISSRSPLDSEDSAGVSCQEHKKSEALSTPQTPPQPSAANLLEHILLHHFTACASLSFSPASDVWQVQAPRLAFEYRFLFDAVMAVSALHLSKRHDLRQATFVTVEAPDLHHTSLLYLDAALQGYRNCLDSINAETCNGAVSVRAFEAAYVASSLISLCTLCQLGNDKADDSSATQYQVVLWFTLVMGTRQIVGQWKRFLGQDSWTTSNVYTPQPDLSSVNAAELFDPTNRAVFEPLLTWASRYIMLSDDDREAYQHTLSYLGMIYGKLQAGSIDSLTGCHLLRALPARVPRRFGLAVMNEHLLALTILAYVFGVMAMLDDAVVWLEGVANKQIPLIEDKLPLGWRVLLHWPLGIANGSLDKTVPIEAHLTWEVFGP